MAPRDEANLRRERAIAFVVLLALIVCVVGADIFGRLLIDSDFHVDVALAGILMGGLFVTLGIEVPAWWRRKKDD